MVHVSMQHAVPKDSIILKGLPRSPGYVDCFRVEFQPEGEYTLDQLAQTIFTTSPPWALLLLKLRNRLVSVFGLGGAMPDPAKTLAPEFRYAPGEKLVLFHNRWGRLYFLPVQPFHRGILRSTVERAAQRLSSARAVRSEACSANRRPGR